MHDAQSNKKSTDHSHCGKTAMRSSIDNPPARSLLIASTNETDTSNQHNSSYSGTKNCDFIGSSFRNHNMTVACLMVLTFHSSHNGNADNYNN